MKIPILSFKFMKYSILAVFGTLASSYISS